MDGGTQVIVFILTFAILGGSGNAISFPVWAGNPNPTGSPDPNTGLILANDYCYIG